MLIEYVANGMQRDVRDSVGETLIARRIARAVYETRQMQPEQAEKVEISTRTGKPKRQYRRRDMKADD